MHFSRPLPQRNKGHATKLSISSYEFKSHRIADISTVIHQGLLDEHLQSLMRFQTINVNSRS
jgi:hypothetical protein